MENVMKYIKTYESVSKKMEKMSNFKTILNVFQELQFKIVEEHTYNLDFNLVPKCYIIPINSNTKRYTIIQDSNNIRFYTSKYDYYNVLPQGAIFNLDEMIDYIFRICSNKHTGLVDLYGHLITNIEIILTEYPQYIKYYMKYIYNDIPESIKIKYDYLFKNDLF